MTTLADLKAGQAFLFVAQVTGIDTAGTHLSLFGPASAAGGTALIAPAGAMTGQLTAPAASIPVQVVTQFAQVTAGDVLSNDATGETVVARAVTVQPDGSYLWSPAPSGGVVYKTGGWTVISHVSLLLRRPPSGSWPYIAAWLPGRMSGSTALLHWHRCSRACTRDPAGSASSVPHNRSSACVRAQSAGGIPGTRAPWE